MSKKSSLTKPVSTNGKGKVPEKGRDLDKFRSNYDDIDWRKTK
jgi:hypothetical protein